MEGRDDRDRPSCRIEGCTQPVVCEGLCTKHWQRQCGSRMADISDRPPAAIAAGTLEPAGPLEARATIVTAPAAPQEQTPPPPERPATSPAEPAPAEQPTRTTAMVKCEKCGKSFKALGRHAASCQGNRQPATGNGQLAAGSRQAAIGNRQQAGRGGTVTGVTIAADAPAAVFARTRELAEALGLSRMECAEGVYVVNRLNGKLALVGPDGSIKAGRIAFE
jgi:hypothetical protein